MLYIYQICQLVFTRLLMREETGTILRPLFPSRENGASRHWNRIHLTVVCAPYFSVLCTIAKAFLPGLGGVNVLRDPPPPEKEKTFLDYQDFLCRRLCSCWGAVLVLELYRDHCADCSHSFFGSHRVHTQCVCTLRK
jgi:hypothetical protein